MKTANAALVPQETENRLQRVLMHLNAIVSRIPASLTQLMLRIALVVPFFRSGLTKWDGWFTLSDGAKYLFAQEFQLHLLGQTYAYPWPNVMAFLSGAAEIVLPVLLVLGLATRIAACGIMLMTVVIQLTIPDGWANFHLPWAAMALAVATYGPGRLSADHLFLTKYRWRPR